MVCGQICEFGTTAWPRRYLLRLSTYLNLTAVVICLSYGNHRHEADTAPAFGLPFVHGIIGPQASSVGARKIVCRWRKYDGNALLPRTLKTPD